LKLEVTNRTPVPVEAEYYYRKARIYHGLNQPAQALKNYEATIATTANEPLYFAPHAALQSGYIYQQQKQYAKARAYYQKALNYKNHAYKNSIQAKAKLALTTLP